jgi:hypothetical protein
MKELPAATSASTVTLQADTNTFHQPSWVTKITPFNLGKVSGLDFTPGVEGSTTSSKSGTFTISELILYGVLFNSPVVIPVISAQQRVMCIRSVHDRLAITGLTGNASVTIYDIMGRTLLKQNNIITGTGGTAYLQLRGLASQAAFVQIRTGRNIINTRVPLGF